MPPPPPPPPPHHLPDAQPEPAAELSLDVLALSGVDTTEICSNDGIAEEVAPSSPPALHQPEPASAAAVPAFAGEEDRGQLERDDDFMWEAPNAADCAAAGAASNGVLAEPAAAAPAAAHFNPFEDEEKKKEETHVGGLETPDIELLSGAAVESSDDFNVFGSADPPPAELASIGGADPDLWGDDDFGQPAAAEEHIDAAPPAAFDELKAMPPLGEPAVPPPPEATALEPTPPAAAGPAAASSWSADEFDDFCSAAGQALDGAAPEPAEGGAEVAGAAAAAAATASGDGESAALDALEELVGRLPSVEFMLDD
jgi:hypothetical protein